MPAAVDVTTLPDELKKATSVFEMWELTGLAQTAVAQSTEEVKASVNDVKEAVTTGGQSAVTAIDGVKQATNDLKTSVDDVKTAVTDGAHRISRAIDELTFELRRLHPMFERAQLDPAAASVSREYEFFKITALEDATDATRVHLDQLEKTVAEAIRREKLAAFLEHIQHWEDLGSSPNPQRRRRK
jgi:autotransporter translocation and assembly factor TamB